MHTKKWQKIKQELPVLILASVKEKITFQRLTCFRTPTATPLALDMKRYIPPNNFKIKENATVMLNPAKIIKVKVAGEVSLSRHTAIRTKTMMYTKSTMLSRRCPRLVRRAVSAKMARPMGVLKQGLSSPASSNT